MRIVHLTQSTTEEITGGLEYHIVHLAEALRQRGHEVIVLNTESLVDKTTVRSHELQKGECKSATRFAALLPRTLLQDLDALGETLAMFARRMSRSLSAKAIATRLDQLRPDIVHQHSYIGGLRVCRLASQKYPVVFTNHTGAYLHLDRIIGVRWIQRQLMKRFSAVIGPSRELSPKTENSHYIPNGVNPAKFHPISAEETHRRKHKFRCAGKQVFLCPRRWAPTKGIIYMAKALQLLSRATLEQSVFVFAGNQTPGYSKYQRHIQNILSTVKGDVRVLGNLGQIELAELMSISRVCIFPSLMEATSLACLEAMASGVPVIGTESQGLAELIQHQINGWLLPMRDEGALAMQIEAVASIPEEKLRHMGEMAVSTVRDSYTWQSVAIKTEEIYRIAAQKAGRGVGRKFAGTSVKAASLV